MKRKLTAAIAALLAACMLCSCGGDGNTPQESGTEAETSVENTDGAGAGDDSAEEVPADDLTGIDSEAALEEIRDTLADFSDFSYMYLYCKEYGDEGMLDENDTFMNDGYEYDTNCGTAIVITRIVRHNFLNLIPFVLISIATAIPPN